MSTPNTPPPSAAELGKWAVALQTRIDENEASAPMRYVARDILETGWVRMASFLSPLLPKIPAGFTADCLVLRLSTSVRDEPLQWPRKLLRIKGHVVEGRTPDMDPAEPALWTLTLLPPKELVPTGFLVDLIAIFGDQILVDPATGLPPRTDVPAEPNPLWTPEARQNAFCRAASAEVERLGLAAQVQRILPVAQGILRLPKDPAGHSRQVAQVVVQVDLSAEPPPSSRVTTDSLVDTASLELRQAIEHVRSLSMSTPSESSSTSKG